MSLNNFFETLASENVGILQTYFFFFLVKDNIFKNTSISSGTTKSVYQNFERNKTAFYRYYLYVINRFRIKSQQRRANFSVVN